MLTPLTKQHLAKYMTLQNGRLISREFVLNDFNKEQILSALLRRKYSQTYLYIADDIDKTFKYLIAQQSETIKVKIIGRKTEILALRITSYKGYVLHVVNAFNILPPNCDNIYQGFKYLYDVLADGILPAYTIAAFALRFWRLKYLKINIPQLYINVEHFIRKAYAGGRSEIYQKTLDKGLYYDVNSMFAYQMTKPMPVGRPVFRLGKNRDKTKIGFYKCAVNQEQEKNRPVLWTKLNGSLCFPADKFEGVFPTCEIDKAREKGAEVKELCGFEFESADIFSELITDIYKIKEKEQGWKKSFAKRFLVSLYGKFGEKRNNGIIYQTGEKDYCEKLIQGGIKIIDPYKRVIQEATVNKGKHILPHISAWITGLARVDLYNAAEQVEAQGGTVAYLETDAIFCDRPLPTGTGLGQWKFEGEIRNAEFKALKTYKMILNGKLVEKAAGVNENVSEYLDGQKVEINKKNHLTNNLKTYKIQLTNNFYKRKYYKDKSESASIGEILNQMVG